MVLHQQQNNKGLKMIYRIQMPEPPQRIKYAQLRAIAKILTTSKTDIYAQGDFFVIEEVVK